MTAAASSAAQSLSCVMARQDRATQLRKHRAYDIGGAFLALGSLGHGVILTRADKAESGMGRRRMLAQSARRAAAEKPSLENELDKLLGYICIESGFCLSASKATPICERRSITDAEFASAVLIAEGLTPPENSQFYKLLRKRFQRHFGKASVKATDFKL